MGIAEILFVIFLVLKLVGVIAWSWWWVCSPLWIIYGLLLIVMVVIPILGAILFGKIIPKK